MAHNPYSVTLPIAQVPLTDAEGRITQPWLYWLLTIQNRTGGVPGIPIAPVQDSVEALAVEQAMADVAFPAPSVALGMLLDQAMADIAAPVNISFPVLFSEALADVARAPPLNPLLAALLMSS